MGHFFKGIAVDKEDFERIRQEAERAGIAFYTNNNNSLFFILESQNNKQPECLTSRGYRGWVKIIKFGEVS